MPGVSNAWTMPIKARIDMLSTGIRTPVGIKVLGPKLEEIQRIGEHLEMALKDVPGTRNIFAERVTGGYYLDFNIRREEIARYGLDRGRGGSGSGDGDRGDDRDHDRGGARAVSGQYPLLTGIFAAIWVR